MTEPGTPASGLFQPCVRDAGASGINVDGLPPLPDFDLIEQQTATLRTAGTTISTGINAAAGNWRGLSSVYEAPEAHIVLSGFAPVLAHARQLETALSSAITCLNDYADRSRELKGKVDALRGQVNSLDDLIGGNDDWQAHLSIVDQRRDLFNASSALAQEILTSDATCASALNAIYGGRAVTAPSIPVSDLNGSSDPISNFFTNALHLYGSDEKMQDQPWGPATVSHRLGGPWSFAQGVTSSVLGTLGATYTLFGTTDKEKQTQAWQGMATLAGAGPTTYAVVNRGFNDTSKTDIDAVLTVAEAAKSVIHYDEWGRDPAYASGAVSFDVASLFIPGGVGVGAKAGGVAGHAGVAGARTGRLLEEAGTAGRWTGKLGEIPVKAHAALNGVSVRAWDNTVRPALNNLAGALNRLDEGTATVRVADGVAAAGHSPFAGAADTVHSMVDRVDQSLQAGAKTAPLDAVREAPTPVGTPETPVPHPAADLSGLRELPGRAPEHQPKVGDIDGGAGTSGRTGDGADLPPVPREHPRPVIEHNVDIATGDGPGSRTAFAVSTDLKPNTVYHVDGRGDFYTDGTGKVTYVETTYGGRGNLNADLMHPQPNTTYVVHPDVHNPVDGASHAHVFQTDAQGRTVSAHTDQLALGHADRSESVQSRVGDEGGDGYDGGHIFGNGYGGGGEYANTVAMLRNVNRGAGDSFYNVENLWRSILKDEPSAKIPVSVLSRFLEDSKVPERFEVLYRVNDGPLMRKGFKNE